MGRQPLTVHVDQQSLLSMRTVLYGLTDAIPKITQMAVNKTLTGVRTDATNEVSKVVTPKKTTIRNAIAVKKMSVADASAYVRCAGRALGLIHFAARQTKKGVTVQVLRSEGRKLVKHAFIAAMKSGHKGVFWRQWSGVRKPYNPRKAYGRMPASYRLPITELKSLAVPEVLGHPPTMAAVLKLAQPRLDKNMDDALNYYIGKVRAAA